MKTIAFWLRWSARDLRDRWLLVVAIAATISLGTGAYAALDSLSKWRTDGNSQSLAAMRAHDVRLYLADGSYASPQELRALLTSIPHASSVVASEVRLVVPTRVDASSSGKTIVVPGRMVGMATGDPSVDDLYVHSGRDLAAADGAGSAVAEYHFARFYDLPVPGSIEVADGQKLALSGTAYGPDYLMIVTPNGDIMAEANYGVVFVSLETAGRIAGHPGMVNELVIRLSDPSLATVVRDELEAAAKRDVPELGAAAIASADEISRRWVERDAQNDQTLFTMFAIILLAGATFAAFNLTTRIVESQRRQIGIGLALGLPARSLAIRPLAVAAEIALLGVAFGVVVGLLFGLALREMMVQMFPTPIFEGNFQVDVFARAAAIGFVLPFAASVYPVWRAVRARPVDAIRTGYLSARKPGLARLARRLPLPSTIRHPLSNLLRTPRRTMLTSLGVTAAVTVLVGVLGMLDTMSGGINRGEVEIVGSSPNRISVDLAAPVSAEALRTELAVAGVERIDTILRLPATAAIAGKPEIDLQLDVMDLRDGAWSPRLAAGRLPSGPSEVMLSERAAENLGLAPGDRFTLRHPVRVSDTAVSIVDTEVTLSGTHPSPLRPTAFMGSGGAALFGMDRLANRATVVPTEGADVDVVRRTLFDLPGVVSAQPIDAMVRSMRDVISQMTEILGGAAVIALLLALLIAYNSASITQDERTRETATMLAFGMPARRVMASAMIESGLIGLLGTAIGLAGGLASLYWLVYGLLPTSMPDFALVPIVAPGTILVAGGLGIVAVALAPALTWRRLTRMNLPATLRVVE
jgi:putative ABC transport system permease protein